MKKIQKSILRLRSGLMLSIIEASNFIKNLKFDDNGLIPAIIQDYKTNEVLMLAYMNKESLKKTLKTGHTYFWSRSRKKLWLKGETSGNFQTVHQIFFDCDSDALLFKVHQKGVACHTGSRSCFYRRLCIIHPKKNL